VRAQVSYPQRRMQKKKCVLLFRFLYIDENLRMLFSGVGLILMFRFFTRRHELATFGAKCQNQFSKFNMAALISVTYVYKQSTHSCIFWY